MLSPLSHVIPYHGQRWLNGSLSISIRQALYCCAFHALPESQKNELRGSHSMCVTIIGSVITLVTATKYHAFFLPTA